MKTPAGGGPAKGKNKGRKALAKANQKTSQAINEMVDAGACRKVDKEGAVICVGDFPWDLCGSRSA